VQRFGGGWTRDRTSNDPPGRVPGWRRAVFSPHEARRWTYSRFRDKKTLIQVPVTRLVTPARPGLRNGANLSSGTALLPHIAPHNSTEAVSGSEKS
jgi:hypothetical protein